MTVLPVMLALTASGSDCHADIGWEITAIPFKLKGEPDVNNVKLMWSKAPHAAAYRIYRDNDLIGEVRGVVFDDYGLPVGAKISYRVEAISENGDGIDSSATVAETFTPIGESRIYDNYDGRYLSGPQDAKPRGFLIDGRYYRYDLRRMKEQGVAPKWIITESISTDGLSGWSTPRIVFTKPDCKFEGNAFNYNPNTGKVVISSHYEDGKGYEAAKIFLAEITPGGEIRIGTADRPLGYDSRDQSLFIDSDNTAYLLSATNMNQDINIYRLDESWTHPVELCNTICKGERRETPFITKVDGKYFFFSSEASGWYPSQTKYCSASDISGEWTPLREIGNNTTFDAQFNGIKNIKDIWGCWSYHWGAQRRYKTPGGNFPRITVLSFNNGTACMSYFRYVEFNNIHGLIPVQNGRNISLHKQVSTEAPESEKIDPNWLTDGDMCQSSDYFKNDMALTSGLPYVLVVDLADKARLSEINLSTRLVNGSECCYKYTIEGSADNESYEMLVDARDNHGVGFQIHDVDSDTAYRYLRLQVYDVISVHRDNSQAWADGIYELTAFGTPAQEKATLAQTHMK